MRRPDVTLATPWQFPTPTILRLPTGLTIWHFHLPGQHIATFELVLPAPLSHEPPATEGVGTVALHAVDEGTLTHPDGRIGELLEANGSTLHGTARFRYTTFGGQAPSRRLDEVLPLFTEVLREPAYAERDIAHHIEAQQAGFDSTLASPAPPTGSPSGAPCSARNTARDDRRRRSRNPWKHHGRGRPGMARRPLRPDRATLVIAGAVEPDVVVSHFAAWTPETAPHTPAEVAPRSPGASWSSTSPEPSRPPCPSHSAPSPATTRGGPRRRSRVMRSPEHSRAGSTSSSGSDSGTPTASAAASRRASARDSSRWAEASAPRWRATPSPGCSRGWRCGTS
ncbi:insulinase family protein [Tessaracoccus sp. HDW20]|nr:insulinase family protein [Tessaracoccus coleopterorum]NHB85926.1 insulinase family protein [Tessaracoccus coleopterorum]